ncbi:beta-xylosidase [Micromonospora echinospora]|uniref:Beta-xylosidase n=1 Tax=Micromonospora echinospora TaxID=1877 RepID=A0ABR6MHR2_MICEC|nr:family 43 glycosylhydrolase [Micromonospora echinospora]MBB5114917.1 beta-xylosidase [Micromonospora echinospora]
MHRIRRLWTASLLAALLTTTGAAFVASSAQAASGCRVTYTISSSWSGGFGANVDITNLGDPVNGWQLTWTYGAGQTIQQLWNGSYTQSGANVTVTNAAYNGAIGTNASVSFGFNGGWTGNNPVPTNFALNGVACGDTPPTTSPSPSPTTSPTTSPSPTNSPTPPPTTPPPNGPWPPSPTYTNPVVWQDFADGDIIRVGDVYYYSASTMHYSPGAPILRSYDLVNWEYAGHSVPNLDFDSNNYNLTGGRAYVKGIWASAFNYRKSNSTYYWLGCVEFNRTYVYTASSVDGTWQKKARINNCYYDAGLLIDDNDTMYVAYGNSTLSVAQLSADGTSQVRSQQVFTTPSNPGTLEGSRFYKRGNYYYIWVTKPANGQYVLRSTSPWGPYEMRQVLLNMPTPVSGAGIPHQGGLVQTQNGAWYYMAFVDAYPGGRIPVLAPINWSSDGWPSVQTVNGGWGASYPYPNVPRPPRQVKSMIGPDTFAGPTLDPRWEWNHNPDTTKFSMNNGLRLQTATVTNDLYAARNTLTHRIQGPTSTATIQLDYSTMRDGDRSGLAMLRHLSAWIGVRRDGGQTRVSMVDGLAMDSNWNTTSTGTERASAAVSGGRIWLRVNADVRPGAGRQARFSYSTDGVTFTSLGPAYTLNNDWPFFMGYRYGIFNYATSSLGGSVIVNRFDLTTP